MDPKSSQASVFLLNSISKEHGTGGSRSLGQMGPIIQLCRVFFSTIQYHTMFCFERVLLLVNLIFISIIKKKMVAC